MVRQRAINNHRGLDIFSFVKTQPKTRQQHKTAGHISCDPIFTRDMMMLSQVDRVYHTRFTRQTDCRNSGTHTRRVTQGPKDTKHAPTRSPAGG